MPIIVPGGSWEAEARRLKQAGFALSNNPVMARLEAKRTAELAQTPGSLEEAVNRKAIADMRRRRAAASGNAMTRTASDLQMALPKVRQPLSSLMDKGIPFNINDPKELIELRTWSRLFYSTHDLVPLLIDIYSKFPVEGMGFSCKDSMIEQFYETMFYNDLNYEEFLPDSLLREYFVAGEVTSLAHFDEMLGVWSSEEILNPDMLLVSKSMFVRQERVQLLVKELVESLRDGPEGKAGQDERPSERAERQHEYRVIAEQYPEMLEAAARDDGIDVSEALISRLVNRASPWDNRGTPFLLRSFRTLLMEESLNAAQDSVCDRLYSPMILATMGIQNMGDGEPWIPNQSELEDLRNDMQSALAADFKLMVHNFGVQMQSVLGRESVPNFDSDYDRVDAKLMQAWGIGQALIMGGSSGGGTYASSALNREVCEQIMRGIQNKVKRHMRKRMEIIAEVQEHWDYDLKGGKRIPIYREIVEEDPETGESRIVKVPKLLIPEVKFASLNLRDESTERAFLMELKQMGVPLSDRELSLNVDIEFEQNLERESQETVDKGIAKAQAFKKMQDICDAEGLPYPPELATHLEATLQLREMLSQTKMAEAQEKMLEQQSQAASPAGQAGVMPGQPGVSDQGMPMDQAMATADAAGTADSTTGQEQESGDVAPPQMSTPSTSEMLNAPDFSAVANSAKMNTQGPARVPSRPPQSDEMRAGAPRAARKKIAPIIASRDPCYQSPEPTQQAAVMWAKRVNRGPAQLGKKVTSKDVEKSMRRREAEAKEHAPTVSQLVRDPNFYKKLNMGAYRNQIESDYADIRSGHDSESAKLLREMIDHYEHITGVKPRWD